MRDFLSYLLISIIMIMFIFIMIIAISEKNKPIEHTIPEGSFSKIELLEPISPLENSIANIRSETLRKDLYFLTSPELEGRMSGKNGNIIAADFIKKKFESFGLSTTYDRFKISRKNNGPKNEAGNDFTQNVYGWIEGKDPVLKDEIIVIGAHLDHIGYGPSMSRWGGGKIHPGADDNASGTVALLEIAEAFSMMGDLKRTVVFQAYSAEEMGLIGSRHYCDNPLFPLNQPDIRKHVFMLNMDMVGYLNKGHFPASFHSGESSIEIGKYINELNKKYSFAKSITSRGGGGSDHACFYNKKVPVAFLHTGGHSHYHTPSDTPDKINYEGIEKIARYAFELCYKVAQSDASPQFNHTAFKAMKYTHDHGYSDMPFEE